MWLSEQMKRAAPTTDVSLGVTTIEGEGAGVLARGEARDLPIYGPGGYVWLPAGGEDVLVIRGGPGGTERCVGGSRQSAAPEGMQPGEIFLRGAGGNGIYLKRDGSIILTGAVAIEGSLSVNGEAYRPCRCGAEEEA